jgi:hypothetical protein
MARLTRDIGKRHRGGAGCIAGILGSIAAGAGLGALRSGLRARSRHKRQELLEQWLADRAVIVDPAVSFGPDDCCLLLAQPGGKLTVMPGADDSAGDHSDMVLDSPVARAWARRLREQSGLRLTPEQTAAITSWIGWSTPPRADGNCCPAITNSSRSARSTSALTATGPRIATLDWSSACGGRSGRSVNAGSRRSSRSSMPAVRQSVSTASNKIEPEVALDLVPQVLRACSCRPHNPVVG